MANQDSSALPVILSVAGTPIFVTGQSELPLALAPAPTVPNATLKLDGFPNPPDNDARYIALQNLLEQDQNVTLVRGASRVTMNGFDAADTLRQVPDPAVPPLPLNPRASLGTNWNRSPSSLA